MSKINLNQNIPSHWAFLVMIILSFLLSWFTVSKGQEVVDNATKESTTFDISKRIENNK